MRKLRVRAVESLWQVARPWSCLESNLSFPITDLAGPVAFRRECMCQPPVDLVLPVEHEWRDTHNLHARYFSLLTGWDTSVELITQMMTVP
jgi:hypothetical protein